MSEFAVMVFPDEAKAYEGLHTLLELHEEGSVTVFGTAVVRREADGSLAVRERSDEGPVGTAIGMLVGALMGVFGGPVGLAAGAAAGAVLGGARDLLHLSLSDDFLEETEKNLTAGKYAIIAEMSEEWRAPVDVRMAAIGGKVIREEREAFMDEMLQRQADARRRNIQQWKTERATARAEHMEDRLDAQLAREQQRLEALAEKAQSQLKERKAELSSKLKALQEQSAKAKPEARSRIDQRISDLRREFDDREQKLTRAYELSQEALKPGLHA